MITNNTIFSAIALDLGTTSIKAALMDAAGMLHHITQQNAPHINTDNGHYESDALSYLKIAEQVVKQCLEHTDQKPPLGLCSQRSSFLIWDKTSGNPITPLISWQDDRGNPCCTRLQSSIQVIQQLTGLRLTPYYFAPKLNVLLQENLSWRDKLLKKEWLVGTLDTFLIWRWTEGQYFIVDASMSARTLLMDIHQQRWSKSLCELFEIPIDILPDIQSSTQLNVPLKTFDLTLTTSIADQSAAFLACINKNPTLASSSDRALINLGTGGFVMRSIKQQFPILNGYLQTLIYQPAHKTPQFAIEGTLNSVAAALACFPIKDCVIEDMANNDIFCIAEPSGLGAPYFRQDYGLFFSHSISTLTQQQISTLLLEAITFRVVRIVEDFHNQFPLRAVYLSGGLSALPCLQQSIRQCIGIPVYYLQQKEASLQGTALLTYNPVDAFNQEIIEIVIQSKNERLLSKFLAWKKWLDGLLFMNN